ncbi:MAG: hypothetical protein A3B99_04220 [Candidatus Yanofskybacteria bacterium RIFCSPHIGHO2_02_FULL_44_12b]|uniref:MobA-like NTP transferase domain-containing protein n=1 Tax=Candidatus Yanofskybacteria bacterium RIFCSPLOWO2_01_FULL_44_22 TaxID=1802697 RepID=A0A1F8GMY0_9BACT|nr:MAG: hypothetical protein A2659_00620 [Candidatus Yanofskybacteria bacterium RIFCSPHIGHO2_01_FULL_44_24]OGN15719.1 MAG: hypothetical protein A3B99_04220 [Candidatus Yanofskybacteria bacterium RIFCSPHIGHO2_02_FULL_44_12b]OGN26775.1 MAG: hypothetical protein A2925_04305 [Candidatus Yanofskybacteria bacterium RIFCSPLOWO2_01_FULL_44_22]
MTARSPKSYFLRFIMNYKVCILAAGIGSRMGSLSDHVNKAILPVNYKGVISHIIEKFPKDVEIIIAVGHKKETIRNYLSLAHPDRLLTLVDVDKYMGPGTGPGYSLLRCKKFLNSPFVFFAADTLVIEDVPLPDKNWFGIAPVKETEKYCTVKIKNNLICQLDDKIKTDNRFAFIGLAGIKDYQDFFSALEKDKNLIGGEVQVSNGFNKLIEKKLVPIGFTWFDTGALNSYAETNRNFMGGDKKFDFSKGNEFLYFIDDRVIKFFADAEVSSNRYARAKKSLSEFCPELIGLEGGFYSYKKVDGATLYSVLNTKIANDFFNWAYHNLWQRVELPSAEKKEFLSTCQRFYYDKTEKRLQDFYNKTGLQDTPNNINGTETPSLKELLSQIDWKYITDGIPTNFHGDLQFDNILVANNSGPDAKFVLLDWRHDFGGLTHAGDIYYDLAKLYGGTIVSYQLMKDGMFSFNMSGSDVYYDFYTKSNLNDARDEYELFLKSHDFDLNKIKIITALIFLNMSPLHNDPFDHMVYYLGKNMLYKTLRTVNYGKRA